MATAVPIPTSRLDAWFGLRARGTTVRRELLASATTFVTMAYILFVNPQTMVMGLAANLPLALAPGMGRNAVVAFSSWWHAPRRRRGDGRGRRRGADGSRR